jgi:NADH pyrophosphatase NudC (nudix superfamily)
MAKDTQLIEVTLTPLEREALELRNKLDEKGRKTSYLKIAKIMQANHGRKKSRQAVYDMLRRAERKNWRLKATQRYADNPGDCPISETPLTARVRVALKAAGYQRVEQLIGLSREDLEKMKGMGRHGSFQAYGFIQSLGIKKKAMSYCPSCGAASERKLESKKPLECKNCGYTTGVKVLDEPEPLAVNS